MEAALKWTATDAPVIKRSTQGGWSDEEKKAIAKAYNEGADYFELAKLYYTTKNSIAGLIHRIRKEGKLEVKAAERAKSRAASTPRGPRKKNLKGFSAQVLAATKPAPEPDKPKKLRLKLITDNRNVTLEELEPHMCKWPIGLPSQSDFRYCGCIRLENGPYCAAHAKIAFRESIYRNRR